MQSIGDNVIKIENKKIKISKKQLKIRIRALIIAFIIAFSSGEIIVRIFDPQELYNEHNPSYSTYPKEVEYDEGLGWSTVKNYKVHPYTKQGRHQVITISHNNKGFRMDHEVNQDKNILVMTGDSLTYGFWVDDKKVVSAQLNKMLGKDWEVINLAVGGYGTDQSFLRFFRDGLKYKPKVVVHTLFNNDFSNIFFHKQYRVFKPVYRIGANDTLLLNNVPVPLSKDYESSYPKEREHASKGLDRIMRSWSHLYILYKNKIPIVKSKIKDLLSPPKEVLYFTKFIQVGENWLTNSEFDGQFWSIEKNYTVVMNYSFRLNSLILQEFQKIATKDNITFILVVMADRISVDPKMQKATVEKYYNINDSFFDYDKPYRLLEEFANSEDMKFINLYPLFMKEFQEKKRDIYLEGDHHLNDYGHELFAREIYKLLVQEDIVENSKQ